MTENYSNLRNSFFNFDLKTDDIIPINNLPELSDNLLLNIFSYCSIDEIIELSHANKRYFQLSKKCEEIYKNYCDSLYCSNYDQFS